MCKLVPFTRDTSLAVSILSMTAITLDRFYVVFYPLNPKPFFLKTKIVISLIWLVAMATQAVDWHIYRLGPSANCVIEYPLEVSHAYMFYFIVVFYFLIPFLIMTALYSAIIYKLKHQEIPGHNTTNMEKVRRNRNNGITKVCMSVVGCFFISWLPYHIMVFVSKVNVLPPRFLMLIGFPATTALAMSTVASNPIVCYSCSSNFRKSLLRLLRRSFFEQHKKIHKDGEQRGTRTVDEGFVNRAYDDEHSRCGTQRTIKTTRM